MLMAKQMELCRLTRRAYSRRMDQDDLVHLEHREARRAYGMLIDKAKREHWDRPGITRRKDDLDCALIHVRGSHGWRAGQDTPTQRQSDQ